jgi:glycosyltransferase involved in cell wall biosynthesis
VIPALNEEGYIGRLLDCLLAQTFQDFEVIVADSSSTDGTVRVAERYKHRIAHLNIETTVARGVSNARNAGADAAVGQYLLFFDADVSIPNDFLEIFMGEVQRRRLTLSTAQFSIQSHNLADILGLYICRFWTWINQHSQHPIVGGFCILAERSLHHKIGGFDPTYKLSEDHQYAAAMVQAGARFGYILKTAVIFDMRRFNQQGKLKTFSIWIRSEIYRHTHGYRVDKDFDYNFGQHRPDRSSDK